MEHHYPAQSSTVETSVFIQWTEKFPRVQPPLPGDVTGAGQHHDLLFSYPALQSSQHQLLQLHRTKTHTQL